MGRTLEPTLIMDQQDANGLSDKPFFCGDFRHVELSFTGDDTPNMTVKILGSNANTLPDFSAAASETNEYSEVQSIDLDDQTPYDGSTGIAFTADGQVKVEVNTNGLRWLRTIISSYVSGDVSCNASGTIED